MWRDSDGLANHGRGASARGGCSPLGTLEAAPARGVKATSPTVPAYPSAIALSVYGSDFAYRPSSATRYLTPDIGVGDFFHPVDDFAVERFLNGDMSHGCCWSRAMPMLLACRKQDHIAGTDLLNRTALAQPAMTISV